jgi:Rrf2 family nitric oxide-sensitive transcriptional repressor
MRLSTFTDFGLRALMLLARSDGELLTAAAIAAHFDVSRHHMAKVLHELAAGGFVESLRGPQGGVRLARPAREIRVGDVVRRLEGEQPLIVCQSAAGVPCRLKVGCRLPRMLCQAEASFLAELDRHTLADCFPTPI